MNRSDLPREIRTAYATCERTRLALTAEPTSELARNRYMAAGEAFGQTCLRHEIDVIEALDALTA